MILCENLTLSRWTPDFSSSGQENPEWTRVRCGGEELVNSVEWVEWKVNPVQVIVCEECGYAGCAVGNYVHISLLSNHVLWTAPQGDANGEFPDWKAEECTPPAALRKQGLIAFPLDQWRRLCELNARVPAPEQLPTATRRVLADGWRMSAPQPHRADGLETIVPMLEDRLVGTDGLDADRVITLLGPLIEWLGAAPDQPLEGRICEASAIGAEVETLHFNEVSKFHWPAFALQNDRVLLALSDKLVLVPGTRS
jgi:hypothetical protein